MIALTTPRPHARVGGAATAFLLFLLLQPSLVAQKPVPVPVPDSLDHNDLHPWNMFWDGGSARFFDWGDAVLAHPFAAMLVPLGLVRELLGEPAGQGEFAAVREAYLDPFRSLAPGEDLLATLETACRVAKIARAHTWQRAIGAAAEQGDPAVERFRDAPLNTLSAVLDEDWLTAG